MIAIFHGALEVGCEDREAKAVSAITPPSPRLFARITIMIYLNVTTTMISHITVEIPPIM